MHHPKSQSDTKKILILDIESNGLDSFSSILTLYGIIFDYGSGKRLSHIECKWKCKEEWNKEAEEIHKISKRKASHHNDPREGIERFSSWLDDFRGTDERVALGFHAIKFPHYFDWAILQGHFIKYMNYHEFTRRFSHPESTATFLSKAVSKGLIAPVYDTNEDGKRFMSRKLNLWCSTLNISLNHHEAKSDAEACAKIYWHLRSLPTM